MSCSKSLIISIVSFSLSLSLCLKALENLSISCNFELFLWITVFCNCSLASFIRSLNLHIYFYVRIYFLEKTCLFLLQSLSKFVFFLILCLEPILQGIFRVNAFLTPKINKKNSIIYHTSMAFLFFLFSFSSSSSFAIALIKLSWLES